jgi:hypothetical protein
VLRAIDTPALPPASFAAPPTSMANGRFSSGTPVAASTAIRLPMLSITYTTPLATLTD